MNYYNIQNSEETYQLLDYKIDNPKLFYSMTLDTFENTNDDKINTLSEINEINAKSEEITNKLEKIDIKTEDEITLEDIKTIDKENKLASDLLDEEVQKALASIDTFNNVAITILNDMEKKLLKDYSYDVSKENDHLQKIYLKAMNDENKLINYLNNNPRLIENFGVLGSIAKGAAKGGKVLAKAGKAIAKASKTAFKFVAKHPKLVAAGVGIAAVGVYAAATGQTFGGAAEDLAKKGTNELKNVASSAGNVAGTVAGGVLGAASSAAGNVVGGMIEGITGIKKEDQWMIWYGLGAFIILIIVWKIYSAFS